MIIRAEMMNTIKRPGPEGLAIEIRRRSGAAENRRFLQGMACFKVDVGLTDRLRDLMIELEQVERLKPANDTGH